MISPMTNENIDRVKSAQMKQVGIPAMPGDLKTSDQVTFQEAIFDFHQSATYIHPGDSVTVTLIKAIDRGQTYAGGSLFEIEWA
jgi:hypothetical protein